MYYTNTLTGGGQWQVPTEVATPAAVAPPAGAPPSPADNDAPTAPQTLEEKTDAKADERNTAFKSASSPEYAKKERADALAAQRTVAREGVLDAKRTAATCDGADASVPQYMAPATSTSESVRIASDAQPTYSDPDLAAVTASLGPATVGDATVFREGVQSSQPLDAHPPAADVEVIA